MKSFGLLTLLLLLPQEKNAAEEAFQRLEEKLSKARTLHVVYRMSFEQQKSGREKISGSFAGTVLLQEGGLARLDMEGFVGSRYSIAIVSNGKTTLVTSKDNPKAVEVTATAPTLKRDATLYLTRLGAESAVHEIVRAITLGQADRKDRESGKTPPPRESDPGKLLRLSRFYGGASEKFDGRDAAVLHFAVERDGRPGKSLVTLWLDSATQLPIRRRIKDDEEGLVVEETYSEFKINEKIDPARFGLPNEEEKK